MYEVEVFYVTETVYRSRSIKNYGPEQNINQLLNEIKKVSSENSGTYEDRSKKGEFSSTMGRKSGGPLYFPQDAQEFIHNYAYVFGGAAAFAVFLRNAVGIIKDTIDILGKTPGRKNKYVKVKYGGHEITINNGDDLEKIILEIESKEPKNIS